MAHKAVIVGGSGLIGRKLIDILSSKLEYDEIISLGRRKIKLKNNKLKQFIVDFDMEDVYAEHIQGNAVFCCLGSTRKKTPDLDEYRIIDHDYPIKLAELAYKNGVKQFHLVSSLGANKDSSNFYLKTKGETEEEIKNIGLNCLYIYQPSVLTGEREERRWTERTAIWIMKKIGPLLFGRLKKYRSIPAFTVAMAMYKQSLKNKKGVFTYTSDQIKQLA
ncbi:MAG: NAD-dependent epimerase/dehydratase family protein [Mucilaginibacter sp.]|nr:NAD-dependent epimerase/dehydratase family protein [Mucilaginibacter sp.]